jgi:hypothetical protein
MDGKFVQEIKDLYTMKQYTIIIKGQLEANWKEWFDGMDFFYEGENTILSGFVQDEAALHGILNKIRDLNLKLISVNAGNQKKV